MSRGSTGFLKARLDNGMASHAPKITSAAVPVRLTNMPL
jgi:hypothetical protein